MNPWAGDPPVWASFSLLPKWWHLPQWTCGLYRGGVSFLNPLGHRGVLEWVWLLKRSPGFTFGTVPGELMGLGRASQENLPSTRLHLSAFSKSYQVNANLNSHLGICRYNCIKHCALNYIHTWIWIQSLQKDYICQAISKMHPPLKNQCWDAPSFSLET